LTWRNPASEKIDRDEWLHEDAAALKKPGHRPVATAEVQRWAA
jgi:hypothetical protein